MKNNTPMESPIVNPGRGMMKVYSSRKYIDDKYRKDNFVEVNLPEYVPTTPQDNEYSEIALPKKYFINTNYPATRDVIKEPHFLKLPILHGTMCPVRFNKGAEFLLIYPTGKIEEGFLLYIKDKEEEEDEEEGGTSNA